MYSKGAFEVSQGENRNVTTYLLVVATVILLFFTTMNFSYLGICCVTIVDIAICIMALYKKKICKITDARFLFIIITIAFSFGQNIAFFFVGENTKYSFVYGRYYDSYRMVEGSLYTLLAFNLFILGISNSSRIKVKIGNLFGISHHSDYIQAREISVAYNVGIVFALIGVIPYIIVLYNEVILYFESGYGYTSLNDLPGLVQRWHYLFFPGLYLIMTSKLLRGKQITIENTIALIIALIRLIIGDRGVGLSIVISIVWLKSIFRVKIEIRKYLLIGIILVLLVPFIKFLRISDSIGSAWSMFLSNNPLIDMLLETGSSQKLLLMTMDKVKQEGYAHGLAYLDFFINMIPGFFGVQHFYGTLSQWVLGVKQYQTQGFSIWAEAYLNFGNFGIPFMYLIGLVAGKLFSANKESGILKIHLTVTSIYFFSDIARRSISGFGYVFLYDMILPIAIVYVLARSSGVRTRGDMNI